VVSALVLVSTALDSQEKVKERLKQIEGVEEAYALYGVYDLLIKIKALSVDSLKEITRFRIKEVAGVTSSLTLMIVENN
jgi:DNA-binding Lrp family transcriptional regulator